MRIGILGTGNFSENVLQLLRGNENYTIMGGFEAASFPEFYAYPTFDEFLNQVDSILIFDVLYTNYSTIAKCIKLGKDVYVESPGLCSNRELKKLELLAYESGSCIQIGLKQRFYRFFNDLEKYNLTPRIIDSNRFVKFNKKSPHISVIEDLMLHDIDVCLKLTNSEVKSIYSTAVGVYYKDPDVVNTRIEFYNGCVANLSASKISNIEQHETKFFQNNTYCSIDFLDQHLKVQYNNGVQPESEEEWGVQTTYIQKKDSDAYLSTIEKEINSFYNCITNGQSCDAGIAEFLQLQQVVDKIKEQLERNYTANV